MTHVARWKCKCPDCSKVRTRSKKEWLVYRERVGTKYLPVETVMPTVERWAEQGWTQQHIAFTLGTSQQVVSDWLAGDKVKVARRIVDLIDQGVTPHPAHVPEPTCYVPVFGVVRRLNALSAIGWTKDHVAERITTRRVAVSRLKSLERVRAYTWADIDRVYRELENQPGPSAESRRRAALARWAPPAAWEDGDLDRFDGRPFGVLPLAQRLTA